MVDSMKRQNYIDTKYYVAFNIYFVLCFVLSILVVLLHTRISYTLYGIFTLVFSITLAFLFYKREYILEKDCLLIKVGFISKNIKYKDMKKCYITQNNDLSYATSNKRICIELKNKKIYISPLKMDEVLLELIKKSGRRKK